MLGTLFTAKVTRAPDIFQKNAARSGKLRITEHGMRLIGFFHVLDFLRGELDREGRDGIIQVMRLGCADDRGGDDRFGEHPGQSHLRHRQAARLGHLVDPLCDRQVFFRVQTLLPTASV